MSAAQVERLLRGWHGAGRREDLLRCGVSRRSIETALREGTVTRVHRGVFALADASRARVVAAIFRAPLTCVSACRLWALPVMSGDTSAHVCVDGPRGLARMGARPDADAHFHYEYEDHERIERVTGAPRIVVQPSTAIAHASRCVAPEELLVMVDAALAQGLLDEADLPHLRVTTSALRQWIVSNADGRSESPLETLTRLALRAAGLRVEPQVRIPGVGRVDLLVERRVVVEVDGREYHSDPVAFTSDRRRDRQLTLLGLPVLRYAYTDVVERRHRIVAEVQELLSQMSLPIPLSHSSTVPSARYVDSASARVRR